MKTPWIAAFALFAAAACGPAAPPSPPLPVEPTAGAPDLGNLALEDLPTPLPLPYADAAPETVDAEIDAAFARARESGKRVIVDLGGNWCSWCRSLAAVMELPAVAPFIADNFEVVYVGVSSAQGETDRNLHVLERFGLRDVDGYPWLIVVEPGGAVLASSYEVTDENHETPQGMVNWIAQFAVRASAV